MDASQHGRIEIVRLLLRDPRVQVDTKDILGGTALSYAFAEGYFNKDIINLLLKAGADPNIQGSQGMTAMKLALERPYDSVVRLLAMYGATQ